MLVLAALVIQIVLHPQSGGVNVGAMPVRIGSQSGEGWIHIAEGSGAGREIQLSTEPRSGSSGVTTEMCNDAVLSGKRQDMKRTYDEDTTKARTYKRREYYYNGIETPQEAAKERCKLKRMRVAANKKRL